MLYAFSSNDSSVYEYLDGGGDGQTPPETLICSGTLDKLVPESWSKATHDRLMTTGMFESDRIQRAF